ncbi:AAEL012862-PA [Aedes aegypti]|uniref:AAEL012862-PA n=1 Tax=Aedes aegypti TaxID=7159 RepID=Q16KV0_AEDAE|nr:AAEL012862-PA [Aedes aegypti]
MATWKRPDHIPFPQIWHTFQAGDPTSDNRLINYRVQDLPPERVDDAIQHMCTHFLRDEPICRSLGLINDPVGVREIATIWRQVANQQCVVVCFREGSDEIFESPAVRDFVSATLYMTEQGKLFDTHQVDCFLSAWGLSVHPIYRGLGIATEILRARISFCRAFGLTLSATVFSHPGSQVPAAKVGFQDEVVKRFIDLVKMGYNLPVPVEFNKLMTLKVK